MILNFTCLENSLVIDSEKVTVFQIEQRALFARIISALLSGKEEQSAEPYLLSDKDTQMRAKETFIYIHSPLCLPWNERTIISALYAKMNLLMMEDEEFRVSLESMAENLLEKVAELGLQMQADYTFGIEWEIQRYLKAFDFRVDLDDDFLLLDNLIQFLGTISDLLPRKVLVFINLKSFLQENELELFYKEALFRKNKLLLLESWPDERVFLNERKYVIDQHFLEICS